MNFLSSVITYVRRIVKTPSNVAITDNLIIDYINRFWTQDVDARLQLFDLKTKYQFQTQPGVDQYNMPLYNVQSEGGGQSVGMYPVYQGFTQTAYVNGIQVPFQTDKTTFFNIWPNIVQQLFVVGVGNNTVGPYTLSFPITPANSSPVNPPIQAILRGHVDIGGIMATGINADPPVGVNLNTNIPVANTFPAVYLTATAADGSNIIVADSGQFLFGNTNYGLLMTPGKAPTGNAPLPNTLGQLTPYSTTQNTINYLTGVA